MRRSTRRPWTAEDQATAERMRAEGASYHQIARTLERSDSTIRCRLDPAAAAAQAEAVRRSLAKNPRRSRTRSQDDRTATCTTGRSVTFGESLIDWEVW